MKTVQISLIALALGGLSLASCSKCQTCTDNDSPEVRICRDDYDSDDEYNNAIDVTEALGYDCSGSL